VVGVDGDVRGLAAGAHREGVGEGRVDEADVALVLDGLGTVVVRRLGGGRSAVGRGDRRHALQRLGTGRQRRGHDAGRVRIERGIVGGTRRRVARLGRAGITF